jgi:hypothetical protein
MKQDNNLFKYILDTLDIVEDNPNGDIQVEDILKEKHKLNGDDLSKILFKPKTFLLEVWKMNLTKGIDKKEIYTEELNKVDINDFFKLLFKNKDDFLKSYKLYLRRNEILSKVREMKTRVENQI